MKVAVATDSNRVSPHFGRCPSFTIADIENGEVMTKEVLDNPGHHPGFLPKFLSERAVEVVIAGGMGRSALSLFSDFNITPITGITTSVDDALQAFARGQLNSGESLCSPGDGKGYGIDKSVCEHEGEEH